MAKTIENVVWIPLDKTVADMNENYREHTAERYKLPALIDDIGMRGQTDAITVEKRADGKFYLLKGFRRTLAVVELAKLGKINPDTGKVFDSLKAIVMENLTPMDRVKLKLDHGQRESLNKVELFYGICDAFKVGYNEREVAIMLRSLLEQYYPPNRKIKETMEDEGKDLLDYYRGVLQTAKKAWQSPDILRQAWEKKLRDGIAWPKNSELIELHKVYTDECDSDKTNTFNKQKPGPKFMERWNRMLANLAEATANGDKRVKTDAMMNRNQVEDVKKNTDSRILKTFNDILTRKLPQDKLPVLDKVCVELEKLMDQTPELKELYDSMFVGVEVAEAK